MENTMSVTVRIPTVMRPLTGGAASVEASGATLREVVDDLVGGHPGLRDRLLGDDGNLRKFVNVFVGDEDVRYLEGLDTPVPDGTEVTVIPAVAGG
jgi:sulfur-carrier protein